MRRGDVASRDRNYTLVIFRHQAPTPHHSLLADDGATTPRFCRRSARARQDHRIGVNDPGTILHNFAKPNSAASSSRGSHRRFARTLCAQKSEFPSAALVPGRYDAFPCSKRNSPLRKHNQIASVSKPGRKRRRCRRHPAKPHVFIGLRGQIHNTKIEIRFADLE